MPEFQLVAEPPLFGLNHDYGPVRLSAPVGLTLVSVALPLGGEEEAQKAIKAAYGVELPAVGRYALSSDGATRLIRTASDQGLLLFAHPAPDGERVVAARLLGKVYSTNQTDAWVGLEIEGAAARAVLERISPLDLDSRVFTEDMAQRTVMEHLGVLILRKGPDAFLLLSASSSAASFLHAIETSIRNVV